MKEIHEYLNRTVPGIRVHVEEHERYDPAIAETLDRTFDRGNHIIVGSQIANQLAEEVVCRTHKVQPYSPSRVSASRRPGVAGSRAARAAR